MDAQKREDVGYYSAHHDCQYPVCNCTQLLYSIAGYSMSVLGNWAASVWRTDSHAYRDQSNIYIYPVSTRCALLL